MTTVNSGHIPVLYTEILDNIKIFDNRQNIIVDATLGLGGHASGIITKLNFGDVFIGFDADESNLLDAQANIEKNVGQYIKEKNIKIYYIHSNFENIVEQLEKINIFEITGIYYDFGVNSVHFDKASAGFSFREDGPLDMRFDKTSGITAEEIINKYEENELKNILRKYGEEPKTPFIVKEIVKSRSEKPITTTLQLLEIIKKSSFDPKSKVRVFQAIRMEVNDELGVIERSLEKVIKILAKDGIVECITFHSLEDRTVKQIFNKFCEEEIDNITGQTIKKGITDKITKKPIIPTQKEIEENPRSRSAKLRIIKKN